MKFNGTFMGLLASVATPALNKVRRRPRTKAVLNNARQRSAGVYLHACEKEISSLPAGDQPSDYTKALNAVVKETRPLRPAQAVSITLNSVNWTRSITYSPGSTGEFLQSRKTKTT